MRANETCGDEEGGAVLLASLLRRLQAGDGFGSDTAIGVGFIGDVG